MKTTYKTTAYQTNCYDYWLEDNLEYLKETEILDKIHCITQLNSREYSNVFENVIDDNIDYNILNSFLTKEELRLLDDNCAELEFMGYGESINIHYGDITEDDYEKIEAIAESVYDKIIENTIEIEARGYSQGDYLEYTILLKDKADKAEVEKALEFIKELFTISETRIELETQQIEVIDGVEFKTEWEEMDTISSQDEFADLEDLTDELLKHNKLESKDLESIATDAPYRDY